MHIIGIVTIVEHILAFMFTCSSRCLSSGEYVRIALNYFWSNIAFNISTFRCNTNPQFQISMLSSGIGMATGMFKLDKDLNGMLKSEALRIDVEKRKGSVANIRKPDTHLVDEAMGLGAKITAVDFD